MEKRIRHVLGLAGIVFGSTCLVSLILFIVGLVFQWNTLVQFSNGFSLLALGS